MVVANAATAQVAKLNRVQAFPNVFQREVFVICYVLLVLLF